jgi:hypothetical protein
MVGNGKDLARLKKDYFEIFEGINDERKLAVFERRIEESIAEKKEKLKVIHELKRRIREKNGLKC